MKKCDILPLQLNKLSEVFQLFSMHLSQRMPPILAVVLHTHWPVTWSHMVTLPRAVPTGWQSQANKKYNIIEVGKSS